MSPREANATDLLGFQIALGGEFGDKANCGSEWRESVWHPADQVVEFRKTDYNRIEAAKAIAMAGLPKDSATRLLTDDEERLLFQ